MIAKVKSSEQAVVSIGDMRDRVTIQRATEVADTLGGQAITWTNVYTNIPARVQSVRGREHEIEGRLVTVRTFLITIRHGFTITTKDRVSWDGAVLGIVSIENRDERSRRLTLECEVGLAT